MSTDRLRRHREEGPATAFKVLFVCTGNLHRSPVAERFLGAVLPEPDFRVRSAGTAARPAPLDAVTRTILGEMGGDVREFTARRLDVGHIERADLVLGLERCHREAAVRLCPLALRRCFTLREFVRLAEGTSADTPRETVRLAASRRGVVVPPPGESDGIADPYGASPGVHKARALEVRDAVLTLAGILAP
ncbi:MULTISPECIES: arsenate reductase/protein-tyrosine-phosphatase family protein [unclassified Streptomyces]|uniref:arsenate reductase/protein-tyrosine-phosphatase family protein n=1 Tax=unclassified Streptomyces TaxID=2593676 RepID=UPI002250A3E3|nr:MULTISPECIES: low molecular weight phosphatase family protein [unclassified Streptomyces]MCX5054007.1 low molecular weight phosphatase family protein [Streptomyces sp. NBC_00474]MCX5060165.1 low molecular weight phosphatase family protein [Streptomyces sp. NBC_00452]